MNSVDGKKELWCPRRGESTLNFPGPDHWWGADTCSYCGSLNPDTLMERLESGTVKVVPTDKDYKIYLENHGGDPFMATYRKGCDRSPCTGPDDCIHWVTEERVRSKFYFQHLSGEQRKRFVALLNEKRLVIGFPGSFYVSPFFCRPAEGLVK